jgi:hypothetical protein
MHPQPWATFQVALSMRLQRKLHSNTLKITIVSPRKSLMHKTKMSAVITLSVSLKKLQTVTFIIYRSD